MRVKLKLPFILAIFILMVLTSFPAAAAPVTVTWFIGLGTGTQEEQIPVQEAVVAAFNGIQEDINLELIVVNNADAAGVLRQMIAEGNAPDLVGPVGIDGSNAFAWQYLDLQPLVDSTGYDLTQFPEAAVNVYRLEGQGLVGLPFATYPSFIYYRRQLFDDAGLPYPPHEFGAQYNGDTWDTNKLREIGMLLTLDNNGKNATEAEFDANNIVQWGFAPQFSEVRGYVPMFGAGHPFNDQGTAVLPDSYAAGFPWFYNGMWTDHFIPNGAQRDAMPDGNTFASGQVAMANAHLWYTCCAGDNDWDIAVVPSYNGVHTAKLHDDSFRILKASKHPAEAFTVMTYLIGEASLDLLAVYGGMPARPGDQAAFIAALEADFPQNVDWQVAIDSLLYADSPSHEAAMPNYQAAKDRLFEFQNLIDYTSGLNIQDELAALIADLEIIGSHRLVNGGFEESTTSWTQKNVTNDKAKCNKPGKVLAFEGECAYMFKGGAGEKSKIMQNGDTLYVLAGKDLILNGMVKAKGAVKLTYKVIVTYKNQSLDKGKLKGKVTAPTSGYQPLTGNLSLNLPADALEIKIQFVNKSASGKVFLDALTLQTLAPQELALPLLPLPR